MDGEILIAIGEGKAPASTSGNQSRIARAGRLLSRVNVTRITLGLGAAALAFGFIYGLGKLGYYNLSYAESISAVLFRGMLETLRLMLVIIPVGFTLGFLMGWGRTSNSSALRGIGTAYVEFFRSMPPLVLIVFANLISVLILRRYFHIENPFAIGLTMGVLALAAHSGSYQAEIIRAGILSVPTGQIEAAQSVGLNRIQTMFFVIMPQAFRVSLPALGNEFSSVIKDSSLLSAISAVELSFLGSIYVNDVLYQDYNLVFIIWGEIALMYWFITYVVTRIVRAVENRSKVPGLEAAQL